VSEETLREKARRIADVQIEQAHIHPHSAHAATLHMRILRSLLTPQSDILSQQAAHALVVKRDSAREIPHYMSPLAFIAESAGEEEHIDKPQEAKQEDTRGDEGQA
jgi:hypothetical protein